ncbi:hypothetical protein KL910_002643 [Ogataea haglerorum]|nr:hypothetical protein KL945_004623 [Ogataea haglerorum]KAG7789937.1 hypothetical protein KL910_002643 [Ogataea haglerorum]
MYTSYLLAATSAYRLGPNQVGYAKISTQRGKAEHLIGISYCGVGMAKIFNLVRASSNMQLPRFRVQLPQLQFLSRRFGCDQKQQHLQALNQKLTR